MFFLLKSRGKSLLLVCVLSLFLPTWCHCAVVNGLRGGALTASTWRPCSTHASAFSQRIMQQQCPLQTTRLAGMSFTWWLTKAKCQPITNRVLSFNGLFVFFLSHLLKKKRWESNSVWNLERWVANTHPYIFVIRIKGRRWLSWL